MANVVDLCATRENKHGVQSFDPSLSIVGFSGWWRWNEISSFCCFWRTRWTLLGKSLVQCNSCTIYLKFINEQNNKYKEDEMCTTVSTNLQMAGCSDTLFFIRYRSHCESWARKNLSLLLRKFVLFENKTIAITFDYVFHYKWHKNINTVPSITEISAFC